MELTFGGENQHQAVQESVIRHETGNLTRGCERHGAGAPAGPNGGWFVRNDDGGLVFHRAPAPSQRDVERLVLEVHARVLRLLDKRGLLHIDADDDLTQESSALAACYEGAVTQRVGLGPMRGRAVIKLGVPLAKYLAGAAERVQRGGMLCANVDGFDLHGRIAFGAAQRERLEELVRYCARPPLANDRLGKRADGRYVLRLKTRWRDGTTHLQFEPIELMERLAAQIPKPSAGKEWWVGDGNWGLGAALRGTFAAGQVDVAGVHSTSRLGNLGLAFCTTFN